MGKKFLIPAGERKRVLWLFSSSIPGQPRFKANPVEGEELTGEVEVLRGQSTEALPLSSQNIFDKGFGDTNYQIFVTPDQDCEVEFETRHFRAEILFVVLAVVVLLAGFAPGIVSLIFSSPG